MTAPPQTAAEQRAASTPAQRLERLEASLARLDELDPSVQEQVFQLLDRLDDFHRHALGELGRRLGSDRVAELRAAHPAIAWLFEAYGVGVAGHAAAEQALESIRPYIHSHGGEVEVLECEDGVVRVRLTGSCSGCTASEVTLTQGVEEALREHMPGFARLEVEEDEDAPAHPPPGDTLLQIQSEPPARLA